jgi:hypothetical protein
LFDPSSQSFRKRGHTVSEHLHTLFQRRRADTEGEFVCRIAWTQQKWTDAAIGIVVWAAAITFEQPFADRVPEVNWNVPVVFATI